jgi:hypothetical protein
MKNLVCACARVHVCAYIYYIVSYHIVLYQIVLLLSLISCLINAFLRTQILHIHMHINEFFKYTYPNKFIQTFINYFVNFKNYQCYGTSYYSIKST